MIRTVLAALVVVFTLVSGLSCKKGEGQGGTSSITGTVYARYYNKAFTTYIGTSPCPQEDVFIIYGDDITFGDDQKTNHDGSFEFKYLREGHYKVYVYSQDSTQNLTKYPSGLVTLIHEVDITGKKQVVTVPNTVIIKN